MKKVVTLIDILLSVVHPCMELNGYSNPISAASFLARGANQWHDPWEDDSLGDDLLEDDSLAETPVHSDAFLRHVPAEKLEHDRFCLANLWNKFIMWNIRNLLDNAVRSKCGMILSMKYMYCDTKGDAKTVTGTFEFRYLQGCMDNDLIVQWTRLCVAIVRFAHTSDSSKYYSLLEQLVENPTSLDDLRSSVVSKFLAELGLSDTQDFWASQADKTKGQGKKIWEEISDDFEPGVLPKNPTEDIRLDFEVNGQFVRAESVEETAAVDALLKSMFSPPPSAP